MKTLMTTVAAAAFANAPAATAAPAAKTGATKRVEPVLTPVHTGLAMPVKVSKRGSTSLYPFATLAVGTCFGIKNKTAANLSSIISNANRKALVQERDATGAPIFETKTLTGADGSATEVPDTAKPKMVATAHYFAEDVSPERAKELKGTPLEGSTVLVWRDK